eukprot:CAMPEP_0202375396 /NCGR_PEP_ID=MMETSP1127-20130417/6078_1 /ASSEMBLY_ACC=CAM_ASM_000462 /TAXON_ID=3047 /ORGANISM="Dunaliella tertiolecta, Strain CCMP1320" /LENGTH=52 /DNA_ID=CAMNT_0048972853 /DNA_START=357 /DNA_END=515 /DNA_ORIENTATION=+
MRRALRFQGFPGEEEVLGGWQWKAGEEESGQPGAWATTQQIPITSASGFLPG